MDLINQLMGTMIVFFAPVNLYLHYLMIILNITIETILRDNMAKMEVHQHYLKYRGLYDIKYETVTTTEKPEEKEEIENVEKSMLGEDSAELLNQLESMFNEPDLDDEDYLRMEDWEPNYLIEEPTKERDFFPAGEQFVVSVIGMEQNYLHLNYAGKRKWTRLADDMDTSISLNDILLISLNDNGEVVTAITLETDVTEDYIIPDEEKDRQAI